MSSQPSQDLTAKQAPCASRVVIPSAGHRSTSAPGWNLRPRWGQEGETFEISQRLSPTRFLVYKTRIYTRVIGDSLTASGGGGRVSSSESLVLAGDTHAQRCED